DGGGDVLGDGDPDRIGQPPSRLGQPGQELLGAAAGIGANQYLTAQVPGQLRQPEPGHLDMVRGGIRSGVARPQHDGQRLPAPSGPWPANAVSGWKPKVFFQVGAACSFSECAITIVASRSIVISPPSAPGAACPARSHACSRAAARAARITVSARGASRASWLTRREITGSDATGPNSAGCSRSTATSARQSPPSGRATARSAMNFPGSRGAPAARHRPSPSDSRRLRPVTCSTWVSSRAPAWDTIPDPPADTMILGGRAVFFTGKVPSAGSVQDLRQALFSQ